jgi:hypothetical protein
MNNITKYVWIGVTSARSNLAYLGEVASRTIFLFVILRTYALTSKTKSVSRECRKKTSDHWLLEA